MAGGIAKDGRALRSGTRAVSGADGAPCCCGDDDPPAEVLYWLSTICYDDPCDDHPPVLFVKQSDVSPGQVYRSFGACYLVRGE